MLKTSQLWKIRQATKADSPLIHCITNPISINGCANMVLSMGAKPIMAEHPMEVEAITRMSKALLVNLGNITDTRMSSISLSGGISREHDIPHIIDLVGVGVSPLRRAFAQAYIDNYKPHIIKGNMSEIKTILGLPSSPVGIDAGEKDQIKTDNLASSVAIGKSLANKTGATVLISGKLDIISDGNQTYIVKNGIQMLSNITGTGCMLGALIGTLMPYGNPLSAALAGTLTLTIAGELSREAKGTGSFMVDLLDHVYAMDFKDFNHMANYENYKE